MQQLKAKKQEKKTMSLRDIIETHSHALNIAEDDLPSVWMGKFVNQYLDRIDKLNRERQVGRLCKLMERIYDHGMLEGKKYIADKIRSL